jgi:hypothetical protein
MASRAIHSTRRNAGFLFQPLPDRVECGGPGNNRETA